MTRNTWLKLVECKVAEVKALTPSTATCPYCVAVYRTDRPHPCEAKHA